MSAALVESFAADFSPEKFSDDYQDQLRELIEAKLAKGDAVSTEETFGGDSSESDSDNTDDSDNVLDLMEALKRSIDASRAKKTSSKPASKKSSPTVNKTTKKPAASTSRRTGPASGAKTKSGGTAKKTGT
jgi:DNA end-binding protein Ku